jgi:hypothetical protein
MSEFFNLKRSEQPFIVPQLVPAAKTVLVSGVPDVDTRIFGQLLAYCAAGGKHFLAFGVATASTVLYCSSRSNPLADVKRMSLIHSRDPFESSQKRAMANLHYLSSYAQRDSPIYLNSRYDQDCFVKSIKPNTNLIVIDNAGAWTKYGGAFDSIESSDALAFLQRLNAEGIAVVLIDPNPKQRSTLTAELVRGDPDNVISLNYDPGAPHEFGGGFSIARQKRDDDDTTPRQFQFWWKVVNGYFDFGWELRNQHDPKAAKAIQIMERQMKVDQLLAEHKSQREIATLLEVDAATISRDVAKLKELGSKANEAAGVIAKPA